MAIEANIALIGSGTMAIMVYNSSSRFRNNGNRGNALISGDELDGVFRGSFKGTVARDFLVSFFS
jgi:hypothetical protein